MMKIGIIREGKVPHDFRVPLTPEQCREISDQYPTIKIVVQSSPIRTYSDEEYIAQGIEIVNDLKDCDTIIGVKEVPIDQLIPNKQFIFFSHTIKEQPYNRKLLQTILEQKISLIDYETIRDHSGKRLIGFGRYAGIVGTYNGFRTYGLKTQHYELVKAVATNSKKAIEEELKKVLLPKDFRLVLTGFGRVGHGAREMLALLSIKEVTPQEYLTQSFDEPVFTQLDVQDYYRKTGEKFDKHHFYKHPYEYEAFLNSYLSSATMYISCHFWDERAPFLVTKAQLREELHSLQVIADISCDINEPIESTLRPSTIAEPIYGYNRQTENEDDFLKEGILAVMAVDNLPCELPMDASKDFGREFIDHVLPHLLEEKNDIIEKARITDFEGNLSENFSYLTEYIQGENV